ncbi:hypothetical protein BJ165DRAFT_1592367 [Panaeolus papilionaceus]|nr:hypothetical protein BJ165DRAFT_1592367 [Panaeolus papilionaceus]
MAEVAEYISSANASPIPTPPTFPTELPKVKDEPDTPLMPHEVVIDEPKAGPTFTSTTRRDSLLYCENVVFKVEDALFCVPKRGLVNEGAYFDNLFNEAACRSAISSPQGNSDENPLVLYGVSENHFRNFLGLIYPFCGVASPSTDEQWLGILHLATEWNFANIRESALKRLLHLFISSPTRLGDTPTRRHDPIRALAICLKYKISRHIVHQLELIITSIAPLRRNAMVGAGLDEDMIQLIMEMRERWFCGKVWGAYGHQTLADEKLGLFPSREPAMKIIKDSLAACMPMSFDWLEYGEIYIGDPGMSTKVEEERLAEEASVLQKQEQQILDELNKERAAEEARVRCEIEAERHMKEEEERRRKEEEERHRKEEKRCMKKERRMKKEERHMKEEAERYYSMSKMEEEERRALEDAEAERIRLEMEEMNISAEEAEEKRCAREEAERVEGFRKALDVLMTLGRTGATSKGFG